ncbi:MAG: hypothetical protein HC786_19070 [Richelia sp. CSU_2_1]|nr:hypothetical protein [Richelia sp. CSU_2_1]
MRVDRIDTVSEIFSWARSSQAERDYTFEKMIFLQNSSSRSIDLRKITD